MNKILKLLSSSSLEWESNYLPYVGNVGGGARCPKFDTKDFSSNGNPLILLLQANDIDVWFVISVGMKLFT